MPNNLIKDNLKDLIERIFQREGSLYIAWNDRHADIDNNFFDSMVNRIYPSELQINKANVSVSVSDTQASFLDLHLSISDGFFETKLFDKRDDFDFDIVKFPSLDGDVPRSTYYAVYISQLMFRQEYTFDKLRKAFSKFY